MRFLTALTLILIVLLLSNAGHADEPTFAPDPSARYRVEVGGGLAWEGGGRPVLASARLGLGRDLGAHLGLVFEARHLFVEENHLAIEHARRSYDDFGLGVRLRAPLGRTVELFFTPMLVVGRFGYDGDDGAGVAPTASWGQGAGLRTGVEVWLGGALWVGASVGGTLSIADEELVEANASAEVYLTARF